MRRDKLVDAVRRSARRGEARHHRLDDELAAMKQTRAELVAAFSDRLNQIETNTGKIVHLEREIVALRALVDAHAADTKRHTGK